MKPLSPPNTPTTGFFIKRSAKITGDRFNAKYGCTISTTPSWGQYGNSAFVNRKILSIFAALNFIFSDHETYVSTFTQEKKEQAWIP